MSGIRHPIWSMVQDLSADSFRYGEELLQSGQRSLGNKKFNERIDKAVADMANQIVRNWQLGRFDRSDAMSTILGAFNSKSNHFRPSSLAEACSMPFSVPAAFLRLGNQQASRLIVAAQGVPPQQRADMLGFVVEVFSDLDVYFTLGYQEEIKRLERQLTIEPGNDQIRLRLSKTLLKCGLFMECLAQLQNITTHELAPEARYLETICLYRTGRFRESMLSGQECLRQEPDHVEAKHWVWLSSQANDGYIDEIDPTIRVATKSGRAPCQVQFEDVTRKIGIDKVSGGRGTAVFDSNGNGLLDVVIAGAHSGCSLFLNNGDGTFRDASTGSGLDACVYGFGIAVGDYNNDGLDDLFISGLGFFNGEGRLYRNNGDGTFTDVTKESGLSNWGPSFTATWVDYDRDGNLDLFVSNNLGGLFDRKTPNRLFHNNGDGTFTDVTKSSGIDTPWPTIGATWGDVNNNGWPDLFLSNIGRAELYLNNGDGTFSDISRDAGISDPAIGSSSLWCDLNNNGWLDIAQATYSRARDAIFSLQNGRGPEEGQPMRLFSNNKDGTFKSIGREIGITECWGTMSLSCGDFNNNGLVDLFTGNGDPQMDRNEPAVLFQRNPVSGKFDNVTFSAGLPATGKGHGTVMADLNNDGRMHLIVANGGLYPGDLQATKVYGPSTRTGNFLGVRLEGKQSHRNAIGARVTLMANGIKQHRLVSGGSNFGCAPYQQHFGLGASSHVDWLEIEWPSGIRQRVRTIPANQIIQIDEPMAEIHGPGMNDRY